MLRVGVEPQKNGSDYIYDFSGIDFIKDGDHLDRNGEQLGMVFSIQDTNSMAFDKDDMILTVTNPIGTDGYAQVVGERASDNSPVNYSSYKIKLFNVRKLFFEVGDGTPIDTIACYTELNDTEPCTVSIPSTEPVLSGYTFLGWADTANAATADYVSGDNISLNTDKAIYAVWVEADAGGNNNTGEDNNNNNNNSNGDNNNTGIDDDGDNNSSGTNDAGENTGTEVDNNTEGTTDTEGDERVPNTSAPYTGANTDNNSSTSLVFSVTPVIIVVFSVAAYFLYNKRHHVNFK